MEAGNEDRTALPSSVSQLFEDREAIDVWHFVVKDRTVRRQGVRVRKQRGSGRITIHIVTARSQQEMQGTTDCRLIVRDKDHRRAALRMQAS